MLAQKDGTGNSSLIAYVVLSQPTRFSNKDLKEYLKERLPDYMVPASITALSSFPLNANGKLDRVALAERQASSSSRVLGEDPPLTPTEETLTRIWRELLGVDEIDPDDDFFDLGGHSLMATQVVVQMTHDLGAEIPLRLMFEQPTIRAIAAEVDRLRAAGVKPELPPIVAVPRPTNLESKP